MSEAILMLGRGETGFMRRRWIPGDEKTFEPRADFAREWSAAPGLPNGPKWSLVGPGGAVLGVGGLELLSGKADRWGLWGFSTDMDARAWAAVRVFARETCLFAERKLGARLIQAAAFANRPEASALLARLDFEPAGEVDTDEGLVRVMVRRRD